MGWRVTGGWTGIFGTPSPYPRLRGGDGGIEGEGTRWIPAFAGMTGWGGGVTGGDRGAGVAILEFGVG